MVDEPVDAVDAPLDLFSITELAERKRVSKQAISKRVKALVAEGKLRTWSGPNRSLMVSAAEYEFAVAETGDPTKEASAITAALLRGADTVPDNPTAARSSGGEVSALRDAKTRGEHYAAELKRLEFEKASGLYYTVEEVDASLVELGDVAKQEMRGLVTRADGIAEAAEAGMPALRRHLVAIGEDMCRNLAAKWRMAATSPAAASDRDDETTDEDRDPASPD